jgi:hypothetical protein
LPEAIGGLPEIRHYLPDASLDDGEPGREMTAA